MLQPLQHRNSSNAAEEATPSATSGSPPVSPRQNKWNLTGAADSTTTTNSNGNIHTEDDLQKMRNAHAQEVQALREQLAQFEDHDRALATTGVMSQLDDATRQLAATQTQLRHEEEAHAAQSTTVEEMGAKVRALESQTPVTQKLTEFASKQRTLEAENQRLLEQVEQFKKQTANSSVDTTALEETKETYNKEIESIKAEHATTIERLSQEKESLQKELLQAAPSATFTSSSIDPEQQHQLVVQRLQTELKELRESHANEMDEILAQLDDVEAEHAQQLQHANAATHEQAIMVQALTHELSTKEQQFQTLQDGMSESQHQLTYLKEQLQQAQSSCDEWQETYETSRQQHAKALAEEQQCTLQAADEARQETIDQAESQFENANHMYVQLKQEFSASLEANQQLQQELDATQGDLDVMQSNAAHQQESFQQQLEQLQQDLDNVQDVAIQDKQHFHSELERFQQVHDGLIQQLEDAQMAHRTLEKTLAMLVIEKEEMAKENSELKVVCEETMAMLETAQLKQQ